MGNVTGTVSSIANHDTADLAEGTNLYYTDERVDDRVNALIVAGTGITKVYDDAAELYTYSHLQADVNTDNVTEGSTISLQLLQELEHTLLMELVLLTLVALFLLLSLISILITLLKVLLTSLLLLLGHVLTSPMVQVLLIVLVLYLLLKRI